MISISYRYVIFSWQKIKSFLFQIFYVQVRKSIITDTSNCDSTSFKKLFWIYFYGAYLSLVSKSLQNDCSKDQCSSTLLQWGDPWCTAKFFCQKFLMGSPVQQLSKLRKKGPISIPFHNILWAFFQTWFSLWKIEEKGCALKTGKREVPGSISRRACRTSRSEFSVVFSKTRVNKG